MAILPSPITVEEIRSSNWQDLLAESPNKDHHAYRTILFKEARKFEGEGNEVLARIFHFFGTISSLWIQIGRDGYKLESRIDEFSEEELLVLSEILPEITDPEMKARIADILRIRRIPKKQYYSFSIQAVEAYLQSARNREDPEKWVATWQRIACATHIAFSLGGEQPVKRQTIDYIENLLDRLNGTDPLYLSLNLMRLLFPLDFGDSQKYEKYANLSETMGMQGQSNGKFRQSREYLEMSSLWWERAGNTEKARQVKINAINTYLMEAEEDVSYKSSFRSAVYVRDAIQAYRNITNPPQSEIETAKRLLQAYQSKIPSELKPVKFDISDENGILQKSQEQYLASVSDKPLIEAIVQFVSHTPIIKKDNLRDLVERNANEFVFASLFSHININRYGQFVDERSPILETETNEEPSSAVKKEMYGYATLYRAFFSQMIIEPMRTQIALEHYITIYEMLQLVRDNYFIEEGHEIVIAKGLQAGFQGDWVTVSHFLVPKIEHIIRFGLIQSGVITAGLDRFNLQSQYSLNQLLTNSEFTNQLNELWGEDLIFDLRSLLIEPSATNLRNNLTHGLMTDYELLSPEIEYMWWLCLRMLLRGKIIAGQLRNNIPPETPLAQEDKED